MYSCAQISPGLLTSSLFVPFFVTFISSHPLKLFSVYTVLSFSPTYPIVPLSGLLLFLLVILAPLKKSNSSPSNSVLKTGPLIIIPLFSILLTYLPSPLDALMQAKLILNFKFLNDLHYFPASIFSFANPSSRLSHHFDPLNISVPFSRSSASFHSFVPSASRLWNSLPHSTKALSILSITLKNELNLL